MLLGAITPDQSGPVCDGSKEVLRISQSSIIIESSKSDCLVSYLGHSLAESYPSVERQSMYSATLDDWATCNKDPENFMRFILLDIFWFEHILFESIDTF